MWLKDRLIWSTLYTGSPTSLGSVFQSSAVLLAKLEGRFILSVNGVLACPGPA